MLAEARSSDGDRLSLCGRCGSDAVAVIDWREQAEPLWRLWLRCGECGRTRRVTAHDDEVSDLMAELEVHADVMYDAARNLAREQMEHDLRILREALARDLIDPTDFAR